MRCGFGDMYVRAHVRDKQLSLEPTATYAVSRTKSRISLCQDFDIRTRRRHVETAALPMPACLPLHQTQACQPAARRRKHLSKMSPRPRELPELFMIRELDVIHAIDTPSFSNSHPRNHG